MHLRPARSVALLVAVISVVVASLVVAGPASAHEPGFSSVQVVVLDQSVEANLSVPLDLLAQSTDLPLIDDPESVVAEYGDAIAAYLGENVTVRSSDDHTDWSSTVGEMSVSVVVEDQHLDAAVTFEPPTDEVEDFDLVYDVIIDADHDHEVLVGVVNPEQGSLAGGTLRSGRSVLSVASDGSSAEHSAAALVDIVKLGFDHVLEGADHILFLIVLILPAPLLINSRRRWAGSAGARRMMLHVLGVSTAFLIGHSASLALATIGWVNAPARPVEILIAASIVVGAIHAIRPIVRNGEVAIAGVFGLVHGLAFAEILDSLALTGDSQLLTLLAFNVGVELAQMAAVAAFLPALYLLSRTAHYGKVRIGLGLASLAAAIGWIGDRVGIFSNPLAPIETSAIERPFVAVGTLSVVAVALALSDLTAAARAEGRVAVLD